MKLIEGKKIAANLKEEMAQEVAELVKNGSKIPHLAAVLVGNDGGSETYVGHKIKACEQTGLKSTLVRLPDTATTDELLEVVDKLNKDDDIDGFIVQLPLPSHIPEHKIIEAIDPEKDVDGFHPVSIGRMVQGLPTFLSATPAGIVELLKAYDIETSGKHCVIIGRSNIVGTPLAILLSRKSNPGNCTVSICHSRTKNLKEMALQADILVAALGMPEFVTADMVKEGAVVIDVGTTRVKSDVTKSGWKLKGDVLFDEVAPKTSYITPVPGGVGPMTIVSLIRNTIQAVKSRQ